MRDRCAPVPSRDRASTHGWDGLGPRSKTRSPVWIGEAALEFVRDRATDPWSSADAAPARRSVLTTDTHPHIHVAPCTAQFMGSMSSCLNNPLLKVESIRRTVLSPTGPGRRSNRVRGGYRPFLRQINRLTSTGELALSALRPGESAVLAEGGRDDGGQGLLAAGALFKAHVPLSTCATWCAVAESTQASNQGRIS